MNGENLLWTMERYVVSILKNCTKANMRYLDYERMANEQADD